MTLIAVDKNKSYDGPSAHNTIIKVLMKEAAEEGRELPINVFQSSVNSLFSQKTGIPSYIKKGKSASIKGFGRFLITPHGLSKLNRKNAINKHKLNKAIRRRYRKNKNHLRRISQTIELIPVWEKRNKLLVEKGWRPWTWRQFCSIIKETELIVYYKLIKEMERKKLDDMNNGIFEKGDLVTTEDGRVMVFFGNEGKLQIANGPWIDVCRICIKANDNKPDMRKWGRKYSMEQYETHKLKPYITIE